MRSKESGNLGAEQVVEGHVRQVLRNVVERLRNEHHATVERMLDRL